MAGSKGNNGKPVLAVSILIYTYPAVSLAARLLVEGNKDIYKGVYSPPKPKYIHDSYLIFEGDEERIEALEAIYRQLFEKVGLRAKYLVQRRKRIDGWKYITR